MKTLFITIVGLLALCNINAEEYVVGNPYFYYNRPTTKVMVYRDVYGRPVRYVTAPYVTERINVTNPVIVPDPDTIVLEARPMRVLKYDQKALIERGKRMMEWNDGLPNSVGLCPYFDIRLPGNNEPGVVFPRIAKPQEFYGARW